ncbi:MAG: PAS domain-containing protein [Desulfobacterales bacterium]|nr:PAS domain-containing protein [Desulfobacterales bacterium]
MQDHKKILDYLDISFLMFDMEYTLIDTNETFLTFTDLERDKVVGLDARTLLTADEYRKVQKSVKMLKEGAGHIQYEFHVFSNNQKEKIPCLFHASLNRDKSGTPISVNVILMSLIEQKRAQQELEKEKKLLEAILFGIRDSVSVFDQEGQYLFGSNNNLKIRSDKKKPLLPLESGRTGEFTFEINNKEHHFKGDIRAIYDTSGNCFAYAETLTDVTNTKELKEKEIELMHIRRIMRLDEIKSTMIGNSKVMTPVFNTIQRCADVDSSVLITGETGVGKELAARAIHDQSHRKGKPFVAVNCAALPANLLESELFGHKKGAFTGAIRDRLGLFREADEGTLFLDEIGDLTLPLQVKLLRVLQEKEVRPVGTNKTYPVDVRILSATNLDLKYMAENGDFRRDLFYRIAVIPLLIPPLKDRTGDINRLAEHFIDQYQKKDRYRLKRFSRDSLEILNQYHWPGNIRELQNTIEYALAMSNHQVIHPESLPLSVTDPETITEQPSPQLTINSSILINKAERESAEKQHLINTLIKNSGNQTKAAKELGISRVTIWRKIKKYQIQ